VPAVTLNVNEDFNGPGPDLGAPDAGQDLPPYETIISIAAISRCPHRID
jgi:hypothetical protein